MRLPYPPLRHRLAEHGGGTSAASRTARTPAGAERSVPARMADTSPPFQDRERPSERAMAQLRAAELPRNGDRASRRPVPSPGCIGAICVGVSVLDLIAHSISAIRPNRGGDKRAMRVAGRSESDCREGHRV